MQLEVCQLNNTLISNYNHIIKLKNKKIKLMIKPNVIHAVVWKTRDVIRTLPIFRFFLFWNAILVYNRG
jgi:hypothetical protein